MRGPIGVPPAEFDPYLDAVEGIADAQLGTGYLTREQSDRTLTPESPGRLLCVVTDDEGENVVVIPDQETPASTGDSDSPPDGTVIGFHLVAVHTPESLTDYLQLDRDAWPSRLRTATVDKGC